MTETFKNVWDAIIDDPAERESCKLKSILMMEIERHIKNEGMTQQQAADKMGITQPRVSDLVCGKIDRFTIDMLVNMLSSLGLHLEVQLRKAA
jgi:predicted XRE-type DNA-binding protein